jgi:putative methyltransferase (TIGR04325 family)
VGADAPIQQTRNEVLRAEGWSMRKLRLRQIRFFASLLSYVGRAAAGKALVRRMRRHPSLVSLIDWLLGYRKTFASLAEAETCAARYLQSAHDYSGEIELHRKLSGLMRESDYPVLFHLAPCAFGLRRVFDLGGGVGNAFYSYDRHLRFSKELTWTVCELPARRVAGAEFAHKRNEPRLCFTGEVKGATGVDLLLVSGALHYFDEPLYPMLEKLECLPRRVIVNRTPFSRGHALVTVQDGGECLAACKLHSRDDFINGMKGLGYELRDSWPVFEFKAWVPLYPDVSYGHYWGFYFEHSTERSAEI